MTDPTTTPRTTGRPAPIVLVPGVLGLVLAIIGTTLLLAPQRGSAAADSGPERQVISRVNDFAVAYNTYDVADAPEYQARLKGLLTEDYNTEFVRITTALFEAIKAKKQKSGSAVVRDVAVETIDDDSAVALAVVDAKVTNTDNKAAVLRQFRWTVNLQKVSGQWRISQFESVAAQPADAPTAPAGGATTAPGGSGVPAPTPTASTEGADR